MYRTLKLSLLAGVSCLAAVSARAEDSAATYVDDTSVVGLWDDATKTTIGQTAEYTNSVELADVNGDGLVDILFANGGDYEAPGKPEFSRVFLNQGAGKMFKDVGKEVFGPEPMVAVRAIRVRRRQRRRPCRHLRGQLLPNTEPSLPRRRQGRIQ